MRYFEDLRTGEVISLGEASVSEADIVDFARRFDPQPFHVDPAVASASPFGGLIASGWHTCALFMRLLATGFLNDTPSLGSPGVDEVRWPTPVRPGDVLSGRLEILETRASQSRTDRGIIRSRGSLTNGHGEKVLTLTAVNLIGRRSR
jgi:acyl dehydratase